MDILSVNTCVEHLFLTGYQGYPENYT
jgi:hypothetical protein